MLVCNMCGDVISEDELEYYYESHGERCPNCCSCGGYYVEATRCECCGEWYDPDGSYGVCDECLAEHTTLDNAILMGKLNTICCKVNEFFSQILSDEEIDQILTEWVKANIKNDDERIGKYLNEDKSYFSEFITGDK